MERPETEPSQPGSFAELMPASAWQLLATRGTDVMRQIGDDIVRGVVLDVLTGKNLRDSTESLTRRRIAALNAATLTAFLKGSSRSERFLEELPRLAAEVLTTKGVQKRERWLAQWMLGLTDKAVQNILRDDRLLLEKYTQDYVATCQEVIAKCSADYGVLQGELQLSPDAVAKVNWAFMIHLLNAVGAQTLTLRGSEKSTYGKLFERLVLGSLLHILGFEHVSAKNPGKLEHVFWLSSQGEKRESDATVLFEAGRGVRFDIGFIGRGNPEISLDKVSRFEREITLGPSQWYMGTIVIVDRVGENSRIAELARRIGGTIVQMSMAYWPQLVARQLYADVGFRHELAHMEQTSMDSYLRAKMRDVPLEKFLESSQRRRSSPTSSK